MSPAGAAIVVADVRPGDAEAEGRLSALCGALAGAGSEPEVRRARGPEEARRMAAEAASRAEPFVVCLGDDATIRAMVDGLMDAGRPAGMATVLGVMAAHASCDFVRTFGIPADDPGFAARRLASDLTFPMDVARITYRDPTGVERVTHFAGVAEVGLGGTIARRAGRLPRALGRGRTLLSFWTTIAAYRVPEVRVGIDRTEFRGRAHAIVVGNGQWGKNGIRLSPRSFPGDGVLDLLVMTGPKSEAFTMLPAMFRGEQVPHPNIREYRVHRVSIEGDRPLDVQADGVALGTTPVGIELIPAAITLRI